MRSWVVGLVCLIVISAVTYLGFTKDIPFVGDPFEIRAAFRDTAGMAEGSPVRIAGVEVGEVTRVEHTRPGARSAVVTMSVRDSGRPVHADATAEIRPRIFLEGNFFVDVSPGTPQAPALDEGETIPDTRTSGPVQVDQVLKALKSDTRGALRTTLIELGRAQKAGAGRAFNRTLDFQAPAYKYSAIVAEALLGENPGDLAEWIRAQGVVAGALDRNPRRLQALLRDFNTTAAALADRDEALRDAVEELPGTLRAALPTFAALNRAFPSVRRFAAAARPGVRSTGPAVDALLPLVRQLRGLGGEAELRGLSRDLRRTTPPLTRLARETVPVLEQLRLTASCATNVLVPWGEDRVPDRAFPATGPVHEELVKWMPGLAGESRSFDANGQWFKVLGGGGAETFDLGEGLLGTSLNPIVGVNPPPQERRPPLRPDVPCETQEPPDLRTNPVGGPRRVPIDPTSPDVLERLGKARETAIAILRAQLAEVGDTTTDVLESDATPEQVQDIAEESGLSQQLSDLPQLADQVDETVPEVPGR